jgi:hypothetical protein
MLSTNINLGSAHRKTHSIQDDITKTVQFILDFPSSSCPVEIQIRPQVSPFIDHP